MRLAAYVPAMEMLATGTPCHLNHSVTTTISELVRAASAPQAELGIRQVSAEELHCRRPGNPQHPLSLDESMAAFNEEVRRRDGVAGGLARTATVIEGAAHCTAAGAACASATMSRAAATALARPVAAEAGVSGGMEPRWRS